MRDGVGENAEVTSGLLEDSGEHRLSPGRRRLFLIDGSKAQGKATGYMSGQLHPI